MFLRNTGLRFTSTLARPASLLIRFPKRKAQSAISWWRSLFWSRQSGIIWTANGQWSMTRLKRSLEGLVWRLLHEEHLLYVYSSPLELFLPFLLLSPTVRSRYFNVTYRQREEANGTTKEVPVAGQIDIHIFNLSKHHLVISLDRFSSTLIPIGGQFPESDADACSFENRNT